MTLFDESTPQLAASPADGAAPPKLGFLDGMDAAYEATGRATNQLALDTQFRQNEQDQIRAIKQAGGNPHRSLNDMDDTPFTSPSGAQFGDPTFGSFGRPYKSVASFYENGAPDDGGLAAGAIGERNAAIMSLQKQFPGLGLKTYDQLWADTKKQAQEAQAQAAKPTTLAGSAGAFVGGMVGSMSPITAPLNFATLAAGAIPGMGGVALGGRIAAGTEAGVIGSAADKAIAALAPKVTKGLAATLGTSAAEQGALGAATDTVSQLAGGDESQKLLGVGDGSFSVGQVAEAAGGAAGGAVVTHLGLMGLSKAVGAGLKYGRANGWFPDAPGPPGPRIEPTVDAADTQTSADFQARKVANAAGEKYEVQMDDGPVGVAVMRNADGSISHLRLDGGQIVNVPKGLSNEPAKEVVGKLTIGEHSKPNAPDDLSKITDITPQPDGVQFRRDPANLQPDDGLPRVNPLDDYSVFRDAQAAYIKQTYGSSQLATAMGQRELGSLHMQLDDWSGPEPWAVKPRTDTAPVPDVTHFDFGQPLTRSLEQAGPEGIARRIDPDTFRQVDVLSRQMEESRARIQQMAEQRGFDTDAHVADLDAQVEAAQQKVSEATGKRRAAAQKQLAEVTQRRDDARAGYIDDHGGAGDNPEMAAERAKLMKMDEQQRDLAPLVSRAFDAANGEWKTGRYNPDTIAFLRDLEEHPRRRFKPDADTVQPAVPVEPRAEPVPTLTRPTLEDRVPQMTTRPDVTDAMAGKPASEKLNAVLEANAKDMEPVLDRYQQQVAKLLKPVEDGEARPENTIRVNGTDMHLDKDTMVVPTADGEGHKTVSLRTYLQSLHDDLEAQKAISSCRISS